VRKTIVLDLFLFAMLLVSFDEGSVRMDTSPLQEGRKILAGSSGLGIGQCKQACEIIVL